MKNGTRVKAKGVTDMTIATIIILIALVIFLLTAVIANAEIKHLDIQIKRTIKRNHKIIERMNKHD